MAHSSLDFTDLFTVTRCRNPGYCQHCDKLIKRGMVKITYKTQLFHSWCIEEYTEEAISVDTENMKVNYNG